MKSNQSSYGGNEDSAKEKVPRSVSILPRLIRLRDAAGYLGMDKNRFNDEVRPEVTVIPIGKQGIAFDRFELDAWVDQYIDRNGRPGLSKGEKTWGKKEHQVSLSAVGSGTSTNKSEVSDFAKALEKVASIKRKNT